MIVSSRPHSLSAAGELGLRAFNFHLIHNPTSSKCSTRLSTMSISQRLLDLRTTYPEAHSTRNLVFVIQTARLSQI